MKINYSNLTFTELVNKIGSSRFFDLPSMLKEAFTRLANTPSGDSRPYKVYTALLTQSGTDAPVATVLENTLGVDVVWIKDDPGYFLADIPFVNEENTSVIVGNQFFSGASAGIMSYTGVNVGEVTLVVVDNFNAGITVDSELNKTPIEIKVYN